MLSINAAMNAFLGCRCSCNLKVGKVELVGISDFHNVDGIISEQICIYTNLNFEISKSRSFFDITWF